MGAPAKRLRETKYMHDQCVININCRINCTSIGGKGRKLIREKNMLDSQTPNHLQKCLKLFFFLQKYCEYFLSISEPQSYSTRVWLSLVQTLFDWSRSLKLIRHRARLFIHSSRVLQRFQRVSSLANHFSFQTISTKWH